MKRIRTRLMLGILAVFLVSYAVFIINIGANQMVVNKSQSLLEDNYPSVKYSFDMLHLLESVNSALLSSSYAFSDKIINEDLSELQKQLEMQQNNITEPGEKELTESLQKALVKYQEGIINHEYQSDFNAYIEKYQNLREYILNIHDLNITLLETKNEEIKSSTSKIVKIQKNVGIAGLTILCIFIFIIPLFLINPIHKLTERMIEFYRTNFNKDIEIRKNNELEKLEEIFEKIVTEAQSEHNSN